MKKQSGQECMQRGGKWQISAKIMQQKTIPESVLNGAANIAEEWKIARAKANDKAPFLSRFNPWRCSLKSVIDRRNMIKSLAINCGAL